MFLQCRAIRDELATCLSQSECVQSGKTGQDCLRNHMNELPENCQAVYKSYVHCRRGLVSESGYMEIKIKKILSEKKS